MPSEDVKLLVFVCNWCSYGGADNAGGQRLEYSAGVRLVRVMCSGRVDPQIVMQAFGSGADGVLVLGCHPGDCHYKEGNFKARNRITLLRSMLGQYGIESERLCIDWVGQAEGERFHKVVSETYGRVAALGPLALPSPLQREEASG